MNWRWNNSVPLRVVLRESSPPLTFPCFFEHRFNEKKCPKPGIYVEIFRVILEAMKINIQSVEIIDLKSTIDIYETLNSSLADVSASPKEPMPETFEYLSFSIPIYYKERAYLMQSAKSNTFHESLKILQPFSAHLWAAILALIVFSYLMIFFLTSFSINRTTVYRQIVLDMTFSFLLWVLCEKHY